ncbi:MAG TPA: hypothetical protein VJZ91_08735 [Blastocatellia bacterium]|nr:hypothetical protein [Blastocatellia bacterium]
MYRLSRLASLLALSLCVVAGLSAADAKAQTPQIPMADRVRLAEAFRLNDQLSDKVWPGWGKTPFAVLLLTNDVEFLLRHPQPPGDFTAAGSDALLKTKVYYRKRTFPPSLLATLFVGGLPTVAIGQAENTNVRTSTRWVVTLMHEHFHQLQYSQPDYQEGTKALNLARGDQNGMWMLNYPFPYKSEEVNRAYAAMCERLAAALDDKSATPFGERLAAYLDARRRFREAVSEDDYKYFAFQLWQEGLARYTEYRVAALATSRYKPTPAFRTLKDFTPFSEVAAKTLARIKDEVNKPALSEHEREVVYGFGAAEALVLDRANRRWQRRYFAEKFQTASYFSDK